VSERFLIAAALAGSLLLSWCASAATLVSTSELVASDASIAAQLPDPIEFSIPASATGEYVVTLEDLSVPATLSSLRAIVTHDLEIVAQVAINYVPGQLPTAATDTFAASAGAYRIHVLGAAPADQGGGAFRIRVAPAAGGTSVVSTAGDIAAENAPPSSQSVLQARFDIGEGGTYQLTVTDHAFPVALNEPPLVLLLRNTPGGPVEVTRTAGAFTTDAGSHDLVVFATAASPAQAGVYSVRISGGPTASVPYVSTNAVGRMMAPTTLGLPAAGDYSFTLADASFPAALTSLGALVVQDGAALSVRDGGAAASTFPAAAGTAQLFAFAVTSAVGSFRVRVSRGSTLVHADVHPVDASTDPQSPAIYTFFPTPAVSAGNYAFTLHDFRFPTALRVLRGALVQGDTVVRTLDAAGQLDAALTSARVKALVAVEPAGSPAQPASGLFGVELASSPAGVGVFEGTQGVGGLFRAQTVQIATSGRYDFTLADLEFPQALRTSALAITRGTELVGQVFGAGTVPRQQLDAGTYLLSFIGLPATTEQFGAYALKVEDSAAPPTVTLSANPASVTSGNRTTLQWSTTGATTCTASGPWSGAKATAGSEQSAALSSNATFELSCTGPGGTANTSAAVVVTAPSASGGGGGAMGGLTLLYMCVACVMAALRGRQPATDRADAAVGIRSIRHFTSPLASLRRTNPRERTA
jgi:hypothetical protein